MTETFALKYRPKTLSDLIGQEPIKRALTNGIKGNKLKRVLMFNGLHGSGKTSSARIVAKSLNCLNSDKPTTEPCGKCENCKAIDHESSLDVIEFDIAADPSVDKVREIIQNSQTRPINSRYKVYILDEVHQLTSAAQNAFLRLLESPPDHLYFILATTDPNKLLSTIRSRCLQFPFKRISQDAIIDRLRFVADKEAIEYDESGLKKIYSLSGGSMRDALKMLDEVSLADCKLNSSVVEEMSGVLPEGKLLEIVDHLKHGSLANILFETSQLLSEGYEPMDILSGLVNVLTDVVRYQTLDSPQYVQHTTNIAFLKEIADGSDREMVHNALKVLVRGMNQLKHSPKKDQLMEVIMIELLLAVEEING